MKKPIKHRTYELVAWREEPTDTYWANIYVAGDREVSERVCREYCLKIGLCVTVTDCNYIYTGGAEKGIKVGLIAYPPFPETTEQIFNKAKGLALELAEINSQWSCTIQAKDKTVFFSRRKRKETSGSQK